MRPRIPIYLAAIGPKNLDLTGRIADGWLGIFFDPDTAGASVTRIGKSATDAGRNPADIDICVTVPTAVHRDPVRAADRARAYSSLYIGGMGSPKTNFYHRTATEMGFREQADEVQRRFLSRDYQGAAAAVPHEFMDRTGLFGDEHRIAERLDRLADAGVTSVSIICFDRDLDGKIATLTTVAGAARRAGVHA